MTETTLPNTADVVLIGAGIMSATLGTVLKELERMLPLPIGLGMLAHAAR